MTPAFQDNPQWDIHPPLLDQLLAHPHQPTPIHALAQAAGLSIDQVQAELARLVQAGCQLDHHPQLGVQLIQSGCGSWTDYLQWLLGQDRQIVVFRQTASTQDAARRRLSQHGPAAHGCVIIADQQYAGRGRLGRSWLTPPGSAATFSLIHLPEIHSVASGPLSVDRFIFATAVAVAQGIEAAVGGSLHAQIKWPNDILLDHRKTAGILVETLALTGQRQAAIIGVGINVSQTPDLSHIDPQRGRRVATSLAEHADPVDRLRVIAKVLQAMDIALNLHDPTPLIDAWRARSVQRSQTLRLQTPQGQVQGSVIDLDPTQGLIVRTTTGEIIHLPAATTSIL
jgi:BirA family biotin operon repressor/biotin-[acetyl-CoA-carboxylase] ligase